MGYSQGQHLRRLLRSQFAGSNASRPFIEPWTLLTVSAGVSGPLASLASALPPAKRLSKIMEVRSRYSPYTIPRFDAVVQVPQATLANPQPSTATSSPDPSPNVPFPPSHSSPPDLFHYLCTAPSAKSTTQQTPQNHLQHRHQSTPSKAGPTVAAGRTA